MLKHLFTGLVLFTSVSIFAQVSQGETLERQMWESIKNQKWNDINSKIAPYFQSAMFAEVMNKEQYVAHAKGLNIKDYVLNNFIVTEGNGVTVVTYDVSTTETIHGKSISSRANRLSVWQNINDKWQWISHAILIPVESP